MKKNIAEMFINMGFDIPKCPIDDYTCPYYNEESGRCIMDAEEGMPPYEECDAFYELEEEE